VSEIICEDLAHRAGFAVSVGNWISPDGTTISGWNYESHHWETLKKYIGDDSDNPLSYMNLKVSEGYIRLVFRVQVLFQVGCINKEDLWSKKPQYARMRDILGKLKGSEIHIFSKKFYVIGLAEDILDKKISKLQIRESDAV